MTMTVTPVFDDIDLEIIAEALRCYNCNVEKFGNTFLVSSTEKLRASEAVLLLKRVEELLNSDDTNLVER